MTNITKKDFKILIIPTIKSTFYQYLRKLKNLFKSKTQRRLEEEIYNQIIDKQRLNFLPPLNIK